MSERVRVAVRIRPFIPSDPLDAEVVTSVKDDTHIQVGPRHTFSVDHAFVMEDSNEFVFEDVVEPLLADFMVSGVNACVLAYGQTGTGKTYTIQGLLPRILAFLVREASLHKLSGGGADSFVMQYVEVYGEEIRDLLARQREDGQWTGSALKVYTKLETDGDGGIAGALGGGGASYVSGATQARGSSLEEMLSLVHQGDRRRATGATNVHEHSSRSHSILSLYYTPLRCRLDVVDLAGSERYRKTHNSGVRMRESIGINTGLLALGNVIRALSQNRRQMDAGDGPRHVPYRSSKLTRLLQDTLGGESKTLFLACVAPDSYNADETLRTLQYCALAMKVVNRPSSYAQRLEKERAAPSGPTRSRSCSPSPRDEPLAVDVGHLQRQLVLCQAELRRDREVFTTYVDVMQGLIEENERLREQCSEWKASPPPQKESETIRGPAVQQALPGAPSSESPSTVGTEDYHIPVQPCIRELLKAQGIRIDGVSTPLTDFSAASPSPPWVAPRPSALTAAASRGGKEMTHATTTKPVDRRLSYASLTNLGSSDLVSAAVASPLPSRNRDAEVVALAKEVVDYQGANASLRAQLKQLQTKLEVEKRDSALLRVQLSQFQDLIG